PPQPDRPASVTCALLLELLGARRAARAELDADFGLGLEPRVLDALHEPQPVVGRQGDEAARDLDDIKAEVAALVDIAVHGVGSLREDPLDESAGGDGHLVAVTEIDELRE